MSQEIEDDAHLLLLLNPICTLNSDITIIETDNGRGFIKYFLYISALGLKIGIGHLGFCRIRQYLIDNNLYHLTIHEQNPQEEEIRRDQ